MNISEIKGTPSNGLGLFCGLALYLFGALSFMMLMLWADHTGPAWPFAVSVLPLIALTAGLIRARVLHRAVLAKHAEYEASVIARLRQEFGYTLPYRHLRALARYPRDVTEHFAATSDRDSASSVCSLGTRADGTIVLFKHHEEREVSRRPVPATWDREDGETSTI